MERFSIYQKKASGNIGTQINIAVFANLKMAKALYEDLKAGRLDGDA